MSGYGKDQLRNMEGPYCDIRNISLYNDRLQASKSTDAFITTEEDESIGDVHDGDHSFRSLLRHLLHHKIIHLIVVVLIVIDALVVLFVFLLEVGALVPASCVGISLLPQAEYCHYHAGSRSYCGPHAQLLLENINISAGNGEDICKCGYQGGKKICLRFNETSGPNPAVELNRVSLSILSIFMVEIAFKVFASGFAFFAHKFEVFDATIVVLSWIIDVASEIEEGAFEVAGLLILLRLWRLVRIVNGVFMTSKQRSDIKKNAERKEAQKVAHTLQLCQQNLSMAEEKLKKYRLKLEQHNISLPE